MDKDEFEWDAAKAESNLAKHGVSFASALHVFNDAFACEWCDSTSEPGEIRYLITGIVNGIMVTVVYTERDDRTRIISARKATKHEQKEYYRSQTEE